VCNIDSCRHFGAELTYVSKGPLTKEIIWMQLQTAAKQFPLFLPCQVC